MMFRVVLIVSLFCLIGNQLAAPEETGDNRSLAEQKAVVDLLPVVHFPVRHHLTNGELNQLVAPFMDYLKNGQNADSLPYVVENDEKHAMRAESAVFYNSDGWLYCGLDNPRLLEVLLASGYSLTGYIRIHDEQQQLIGGKICFIKGYDRIEKLFFVHWPDGNSEKLSYGDVTRNLKYAEIATVATANHNWSIAAQDEKTGAVARYQSANFAEAVQKAVEHSRNSFPLYTAQLRAEVREISFASIEVRRIEIPLEFKVIKRPFLTCAGRLEFPFGMAAFGEFNDPQGGIFAGFPTPFVEFPSFGSEFYIGDREVRNSCPGGTSIFTPHVGITVQVGDGNLLICTLSRISTANITNFNVTATIAFNLICLAR